MKWKHRHRRLDENGFTKKFWKHIDVLKRTNHNHYSKSLHMSLQHHGYYLGTGGWENFRENSKRLDAAIIRIRKMHREYRRKHR